MFIMAWAVVNQYCVAFPTLVNGKEEPTFRIRQIFNVGHKTGVVVKKMMTSHRFMSSPFLSRIMSGYVTYGCIHKLDICCVLILVLWLIYLFFLVLLWIKEEKVKRETRSDQEDVGNTGHDTSGRRGLSMCSWRGPYKVYQPLWGCCSSKNSGHHKTLESKKNPK